MFVHGRFDLIVPSLIFLHEIFFAEAAEQFHCSEQIVTEKSRSPCRLSLSSAPHVVERIVPVAGTELRQIPFRQIADHVIQCAADMLINCSHSLVIVRHFLF